MYFSFCSLYYIYASDVKSAQTQIKCLVWGCKAFGLRGEGRREGGWYGVNMNRYGETLINQ